MDIDKVLIKVFFESEFKLKRSNFLKLCHAVKHNKYPLLVNYIQNKYKDSQSLKETLYRIYYHICIRPVCHTCGKPVKFIGKDKKLFAAFCCNQCAGKNKDTIKKKKATQLKNWGTENCYDSEKYKQQYKQKYGVDYIWQREDIKDKRKKSLIQQFGDIQTANKELMKRAKETFYKETGYITPALDPNIQKLRYNTMHENNSFNTSKGEEYCYSQLCNIFDTVIRQYQDGRYPYNCDFYIPKFDLFIEYNGSWTHQFHAYDENNEQDKQLYTELSNKAKTSKYYQNSLETWTIRDVNKRNTAKNNHLKFIELWNNEDVDRFIYLMQNSLSIKKDNNKLSAEFNWIGHRNGKCILPCKRNYIIRYFQQNSFYYNELQLWKNIDIKLKLIINRLQYTNKQLKDINDEDILKAFKVSGIYYGYSQFSPFLTKWFHETYHTKICYDPCGGWGHRLLGSIDIQKYIYNDLSKTTYENVKNIAEYFHINNAAFYCQDANVFVPDDDFDVMFTCPPYYNVEQYECGYFKDSLQYNQFIDNLFKCFYHKKSCKTFGLVIREDCIDINKYPPKIQYELTQSVAKYLSKNSHKYKEYLYIYQK